MPTLTSALTGIRATQTNSPLQLVAVLLSVGIVVLAAGCSGSTETVKNAQGQYPAVLRPASFDTVYSVEAIDQRPEPQGGMRAIVRRMDYPEGAKDAGISGQVMVGFIVAPDGRATNIQVVEAVHPLLDNEARRVICASPFSPGRLSGEPVPVRVELPLTFRQTGY